MVDEVAEKFERLSTLHGSGKYNKIDGKYNKIDVTLENNTSSRPLETWYDSAQEHFVALLSTNLTKQEETVLFMLQTLQIESKNEIRNNDYSFKEEELAVSSTIPVSVPNLHEDARPLLIKFSLDKSIIAIQLSSTEVRVVQTAQSQNLSQTNACKQWTIDLSYSSKAYSTRKSVKFPWASTNNTETDSECILPGAIIWSDHGGKSQDLILITNRAVRFYKVSIARNQLAKTRTYYFLNNHSFWYEPKLRVLLVGRTPKAEDRNDDETILFWNQSHEDTSEVIILLHAFFLHYSPIMENTETAFLSSSRYDTTDSLLNSSTTYKFQLELLPPLQLPTFALYQQTNNNNNNNSSIALVNLYGKAYCIHVAETFIYIFHLDKVRKTISLVKQYPLDGMQQPMIVSTVDSILCIHCSYLEKTDFYDIAHNSDMPFCSANSSAFHKAGATNIYKDGFSFLFPHFLLHSDGQLFQLRLNLAFFTNFAEANGNNDTESIIRFLLRRRSTNAHTLVLQFLRRYIQQEHQYSTTAQSTIETWIETIATLYAEASDAILAWDYEFSVPLIHKTSFEEQSHSASNDQNDTKYIPSSFVSAITQTEVLEAVFLPCAFNAFTAAACSPGLINLETKQELLNLSNVSLRFIAVLSSHSILPCPALICFIVSLKWRLNDIEGLDTLLRSYLTSDAINFTARLIKKLFSNTRNGYQIVRQGTGEFAEILLLIATSATFNDSDSNGRSLQLCSQEQLQRQKCQHLMIRNAIDLMASVALYTTAAKHLLRLGRIMDAVSFCLLELEMPYPFQIASQSASSIPGIRAVDFFVAFSSAAAEVSDEAERVHLFHYLYTFLLRWDKDSLIITAPALQDNNSSTSTSSTHLPLSEGNEINPMYVRARQQSKLAEEYPIFPDHHFGNSSEMRLLFGFSDLL